jgi:DNA-binding CsgD family transcriptional regulator
MTSTGRSGMIKDMDEPTGRDGGTPLDVDLSSLSEREREVLREALTGAPAAAIAVRLSLTEATVRSHLAHIYAKLDVAGRVELLARVKGSTHHDLRSSEPTSKPADREPPSRPLRIPFLAAGIAAVALLAFAVIRPDLPPPSDLASIDRLVEQGKITAVDLRGDTLFVMTIDGRRYRVDGVSEQAVGPMQAAVVARGGDVSGGGDTLAVTLLMVATGLLPAALVVLALPAALRWRRRPPNTSPRSASS